MLRISAFLLATVLSITGCGANESSGQKVHTEPAAGLPANPKVLLNTVAKRKAEIRNIKTPGK